MYAELASFHPEIPGETNLMPSGSAQGEVTKNSLFTTSPLNIKADTHSSSGQASSPIGHGNDPQRLCSRREASMMLKEAIDSKFMPRRALGLDVSQPTVHEAPEEEASLILRDGPLGPGRGFFCKDSFDQALLLDPRPLDGKLSGGNCVGAPPTPQMELIETKAVGRWVKPTAQDALDPNRFATHGKRPVGRTAPALPALSEDSKLGEARDQPFDPSLSLSARGIPSGSYDTQDTLVLPSSRGSVGHPRSCMRPCIFFASSMCSAKWSCEYCHLPHARSTARLDKWNRQILRDLSFKELSMLVLPVLRARLPSSNIDDLEELCHQAEQVLTPVTAAPERHGRGGIKLAMALHAMATRVLIKMLTRSLDKHRGQGQHWMEPISDALCQLLDASQDLSLSAQRGVRV